MKKNIPSSKDIRKVLGESVFNPREPVGAIKIIMEINDPAYLESRAMEFINEARNHRTQNPTEHQLTVYHERIAKAISLLALARLLVKV